MPRLLLPLLLAWSLALPAGEAALPDFGPSIAPAKGEPRITLAGLRGKAVLLLFGQTWNLGANRQTSEMLPQVEAAWAADRRIVLLLVMTDVDAAAGAGYLAGHGGDPGRWFVLGDFSAAWTIEALGRDDLWQYAVLAPDGTLTERGGALATVGKPGAVERRYAVAASPALAQALPAAVRLLPEQPELPAGLDRACRLAEIGCLPESIALAGKASRGDQAAFRSALHAGAASRAADLIARLAGQGDERMEAYVRLRELLPALKGSDEGRAAEAALRALGRDREVQHELAAERAWNAALARIQDLAYSQRKPTLDRARTEFARLYGDTWIARTLVGVAP